VSGVLHCPFAAEVCAALPLRLCALASVRVVRLHRSVVASQTRDHRSKFECSNEGMVFYMAIEGLV
jgi:hypothetical protein